MVISLLIPFCSALEIDLDSPKEVETGEEFTVSVSADSDETFDVKIFVHDSDDEKILRSEYVSEIFDEEEDSWEDPWFYIKEVFPDQDEYEITVPKEDGKMEICLRLRDSSNTDGGFEQVCNKIKVIREEQEDDEEDKTEKEDEEPAAQEKTDYQPEEISLAPEEKIMLNSVETRPLNSPNETKTKDGTKTTFILYGFTGFCVLTIVLLSLRKL